MKVIPRPYQELAVEAGLKGLLSPQQRALIVLATGLGKTLTVAFLTKRFAPKRALFLVHNNFILEHAIQEFKLVFDKKTRMAVYNGMSKKGAEEAQILFSTWQTMGKRLNEWPRDYFDLVIVDEAHHSEAETYRPVIDWFRAPKVAITATPDRSDDADIRIIFGSEVINISLEEAVVRGWLPKIEYHILTDETLDEDVLQQITEEIRIEKKRFTMAEVNRRLFIRKRDDEIAKMIDEYPEKGIVFCPNIAYADRMTAFLASAASFHSQTGKGIKDTWKQNNKTLASLANNKLRRVCAVNAFNEGVNVPSVGLVVFCRATDSATLFRQQLGRGARPGKDKLTVLDFVGNLERVRDIIEMMNRITMLRKQYFSKESNIPEEDINLQHKKSEEGSVLEVLNQNLNATEEEQGGFLETIQTPIENSDPNVITNVVLDSEDIFKAFTRTVSDKELPVEVSGEGFIFSFGRIVVDLVEVLNAVITDYYPTYEEFLDAVKKLPISNIEEYQKFYREDSRLPSNPNRFYKDKGWISWNNLFGKVVKNYYPTYEEFLDTVKKLPIQTKEQYIALFSQDPRLHSDPRRFYKDKGWTSWRVIFGKNLYPTYKEFLRAVKKLGIKTKEQYAAFRNKDQRLPSSPAGFYKNKGWISWGVLFGTERNLYPTYKEFLRAVKKLGITTSTEYKKFYRKDLRLPSDPFTFYKNKGWTSWSDVFDKVKA